MDFEDIIDNPEFYILGGGGSIAVILGWLFSKKAMEFSLPFWQVLVILVVIWIAAAFFASRE